MKRFTMCLAGAMAIALATRAIGQEAANQTPLASNFLYNYYTQPGASEVTAGMYPAPYWSPPNVGHTYYTYQPLMPHEHMYEHRRNYYQYYGGPGAFYQDPCRGCANEYGLNKTTVVWQNGASHVGLLPFNWDCFHCLGDHCASHRNCMGDGCGAAGCGHGHCGHGQCAGGAGCASGTCQ